MSLQRPVLPAPDYGAFRGRHWAPAFRLREPSLFYEPIPVSERLVQAIWADQLFETSNLTDRDGRPLEIQNPGRWNAEGGPDFTGAQLRLGNKTLRGDVEIHLHATGWNVHQHHKNPAYNGVVLDVCLWDFDPPSPLYTLERKPVPQLALHSRLQCSLEELTESLDPDRYPFSPTRLATRRSPLLQLTAPEIAAYVDSAGIFRFEQKVIRISELTAQYGADETAYQLLAETLGYKHNKLAFRLTSLAIPLRSLLLLPHTDSRINALRTEAARHRIRESQARPANHPQRRLAALAILAEHHPRPAEWFHHLLKNPAQLRHPPPLRHPFWSWHFHHRSRKLPKPLALLGAARWKEIVTNAILPFCAATLKSDAAEEARKIYREFPCPQPNRAARQMAYDLGLPPPAKTLQQQGFIQMYRDFDLLLPDR